MDSTVSGAATGGAPLEVFLREYLDRTGGAWDEVEPQVYDVALPEGTDPPPGRDRDGGGLRLTFDPEALPEHPAAQLASFGTPLVDRLLADALRRGRAGRFYFVGLNLRPHDLLGRVRRSVRVAAATIQIEHVRALHFPQVVFWFQAAFVSDQKEQIILPVAVDLHYGREVRHRDELLAPARLAEHPAPPLPPARAASLASGYRLARAQILRSATALANTRGRELTERCDLQIARLTQYYTDLRDELDEQKRRSKSADAAARHAERVSALEREHQVRATELRNKSVLHVDLRLLQLLRIEQPKLLVRTTLAAEGGAPARLDVVWDPLTDALEAVACPHCGTPSYDFTMNRFGQIGCAACPVSTGAKPPRR
ncbi:hypothetical protein [Frigoriglobus tundricola]|uniref:Uncharacterized protein n=1 Tax=Frigoriglobus tundricola TaxID=2774151 RepID=A0A6M5YLF7_9BACT|nr:hypothetical protein [Frigoriglobus tundricola]QJW94136.1 hypothetical protein FTUN_1655 [Frigoriglobus tundricola]